MSRVAFLFDEHIDPRFLTALRRRLPTLDARGVGEPQAPRRGTPDEQLLEFCEGDRRILITQDRASLPGHIRNHLTAGRTLWGVFVFPYRPAFGPTLEDLVLVAEATEAEEWIGQIWSLPITR